MQCAHGENSVCNDHTFRSIELNELKRQEQILQMVGEKHSICEGIEGANGQTTKIAARMEVRGSRQKEGCKSVVEGLRL